MLDVTFFGVRGSTPCSDPAIQRYGGNTSCVLVRVDQEDPIVCDLGTGVRYLSRHPGIPIPFSGTALLSHLHWDHIQGLPFFTPMLRDGAELEIVGPVQQGETLANAFAKCIAPPVFPVGLADLPGSFRFRETSADRFSVGSAQITVFPVTHVGPTNGYRIDHGSASMAYISDFQQPGDGSFGLSPEVVTACRGVDLLVHDAQYNPEEFAAKSDWGHCTVEYAVEVARGVEAKRLVLFHHDPNHDDDWVDEAQAFAAGLAGSDFQVLAAREGMTLQSGR